MENKKDIIVSGFSNFGLKKLMPWVKSMEKVGYTGDVLCVVYGNNPDLINAADELSKLCLLYTSPSPRDRQKSRMPSSA